MDGKTESDVLIVTFNDDVTRIVPKDINNIDYVEIQKQVKEGTLTIKDAE